MSEVHVMLDLETFGIGRDAAIVSIGACRFDPDTGESSSRYHLKIDLAGSKHLGRLDPSTVEWWLKQSDAARAELLEGNRVELGQALADFKTWLLIQTKEAEPTYRTALRLWSNGPTFDEVILADAYARYGMQVPWHFKASRCCRTILDVAKRFAPALKLPKPTGTKHNALVDAESQALGIAACLRAIRAAGAAAV